MNILLVYINFGNKSIDDPNIFGGIEMFCQRVYKNLDNVYVCQISVDDNNLKSSVSRENISNKILQESKRVNADVIINNFSSGAYTGKTIQKSHIPIMNIIHDTNMFPSVISRYNHLCNKGHSVFFVSKFQKEYYDKMSDRINDSRISFVDYINPSFCDIRKDIKNIVYDCGTIGRCQKTKNPFLLKEMLRDTKMKSLVLTSTPMIDLNDNSKFEKIHIKYYETAKSYNDVLWNLKHDKVLENISKCGSYFSTWDMETFGITALEALSCGVPIILNSHKSGTHASEIIPASKEHYKLIPKNDKDALVSAIKSFEKVDRKEIQEMTMEKHSLEKWKSHFTNCIDRTIDKFKKSRGSLNAFMT